MQMTAKPKTAMKIHICFATNNRYAPHAAALIASIMDNKCDSDEIVFYFLSDKTSKRVQNSFREMSQQWGFALHIIEISDELFKDFPLFQGNRTAYLRILVDRVIPKSVDKILYLDCDIIVATSLTPLWETDISGKYAAVVPDIYIHAHVPSNNIPYFNSGVMLFNLKKYRADNMAEKVLQFGYTFPEKLIMPDQDMFNAVFQGNVHYLSQRWNIMCAPEQRSQIAKVRGKEMYPYSDEELREAEQHPGIFHLTSKPWLPDCIHIARSAYWEYAKKTPFYKEACFNYYWSVLYHLPRWIISIRLSRKRKRIVLFGVTLFDNWR